MSANNGIKLTVQGEYLDGAYDIKSPEELIAYYDWRYKTYNAAMDSAGYKGPEQLTNVAVPHLATLLSNGKRISILDIGAGTGDVGGLLREKVTNQYGADSWSRIDLDGLDASSKMLEMLHTKTPGIYRNIYHEILLVDKPSKTVTPEAYDVVMGVGIFSVGAMSADHFWHLVTFAKKNALIIFGLRETWYTNLGLQKKLDELESQKSIRLIKKYVIDDYVTGVPGKYFVYERL